MSQPGGPAAVLHRQHLSKVQKTVLKGDVTKGTAGGCFFFHGEILIVVDRNV
jgi:hypothetical protein